MNSRQRLKNSNVWCARSTKMNVTGSLPICTGDGSPCNNKGSRPPSSEDEVGAELDHAAVLHQRWLQPQRAISHVLDLDGAVVQHVVEVQVPGQANPLGELDPLVDSQVETRVPAFPL